MKDKNDKTTTDIEVQLINFRVNYNYVGPKGDLRQGTLVAGAKDAHDAEELTKKQLEERYSHNFRITKITKW